MGCSLFFVSLKNAYGRIAFIITGLVTVAPGFYGFVASKTALPSIPTFTVMLVAFLVCAVVFSIIRIYNLEKQIQPILVFSIGPIPKDRTECASIRLTNPGSVSAEDVKVRLMKVMFMDGDTVHEHRESLRRLETDKEIAPIRSGEDKCYAIAKPQPTLAKSMQLQYWRAGLVSIIQEDEYLLELQALSKTTPPTTETIRLFPGPNGCNVELWRPENI